METSFVVSVSDQIIIIIIIVGFIERKIDANPQMRSKKGESRDKHGSTSKKCPPGYNKGGGYASLKKCVFSWLLKRSIVCSDPTVCGSLFHSAGAATAKPHLPMCFLGQAEEIDRVLS